MKADSRVFLCLLALPTAFAASMAEAQPNRAAYSDDEVEPKVAQYYPQSPGQNSYNPYGYRRYPYRPYQPYTPRKTYYRSSGPNTRREKRDWSKYSIRPFEIALVTPVNIFHPKRKVIIGLSLNIIYGKTNSAYGLEIGGVLNRETEDFGGIQIAAGANWVHRDAYGLMIGGVVNKIEGNMWGLQIAGGANLGFNGACMGVCIAGFMQWYDWLRGVQISMGCNFLVESGKGVQIGGSNFSKGDFSGIQISGVFNWVNKEFKGFQLSMVNLYGKMTGLQISAIANIGASDGAGIQLSLVNVSEDIHGLQIGAFNMAEDVKGVQIGIVNVARKLKGVQIGALNIATKNWLPFMVALNAGF